MKLWTAFCLMVLAACLISGVALAGIYGETVMYKSGQPDQQTVTKMYLDADKLRIEQPGEDGSTIIIYRGDKDLVWMIRPGEKLYQETTKEDMQKMKAQMEQARKMMDEQMKNMPPEQRKQMEEMMGKMPGAQAGEKKETVYKRIGKGEKVDDYTCEHYAAFVDGEKTWELWTVDYEDVHVDFKDMAPLEALGQFFAEIAGGDFERYFVGTQEPFQEDQESRFHGMPVKWTDIEADSVVHVNQLKVLEKRKVDAALFEMPEGFKKADKPTLPGDK